MTSLGSFGKTLSSPVDRGKYLDGEELAKYYTAEWRSFQSASRVVNGICAALNRHWIKREVDGGSATILEIYTLAVVTWKQHLVKEMHNNVTSTVLKLIERQRLGEAIKRRLIWSVLENYVEFDGIKVDSRSQLERESDVHKLLSFLGNFEKLFLEDTKAFYTKESVEFIANNPFTEYMRKVDHWLYEEQFRCELYLHLSTQEGLIKTCEKVLIANQLDLFKNEFRSLLIAGQDEDLARIYFLCNRVDGGLAELKAAFEKHIEERFASVIKACDERTWTAFVNEPCAHFFRYELYELNSAQEGYASERIKKLIVKHYDLIEDKFRCLLLSGKDEELARMYSLTRSVGDELGDLRNMLEKHIEEQGALAMERCGEKAVNDPIIYVNAVLEVHRHYSTLVERSFRNESGFVQALDKACATFINKNNVTIIAENTSKSAELLARYCDWLLKKGVKNSNEAELKDFLTEVMIVFKYIDDKDIFEKFYSKMLAKRLVGSLSVNDDAESRMISKLKQMCGFEYTSKLQSMLTNWRSSKDLTEAFKEHERHASTSLNLDFSIVVFNSGAWPFRQILTFELLAELGNCINKFTTFYNQRHNGRKLTWLPTLSKGELTTNCFQN
uniref:Cullin family profile domain-containing protein n=1 Tax=Plectus sambesii TaxID=2011161 RepID=A0A914XRU0_9BILA